MARNGYTQVKTHARLDELKPLQTPPGWSQNGWVAHLRRVADACRTVNPELSERYQRWADGVETHDATR